MGSLGSQNRPSALEGEGGVEKQWGRRGRGGEGGGRGSPWGPRFLQPGERDSFLYPWWAPVLVFGPLSMPHVAPEQTVPHFLLYFDTSLGGWYRSEWAPEVLRGLLLVPSIEAKVAQKRTLHHFLAFCVIFGTLQNRAQVAPERTLPLFLLPQRAQGYPGQGPKTSPNAYPTLVFVGTPEEV